MRINELKSMNLINFLSVSGGFESLLEFTRLEFSSENLLFYADCKQFTAICKGSNNNSAQWNNSLIVAKDHLVIKMSVDFSPQTGCSSLTRPSGQSFKVQN